MLKNHAKLNQEDIEREKLKNKQLEDEQLEMSLKQKVLQNQLLDQDKQIDTFLTKIKDLEERNNKLVDELNALDETFLQERNDS